MELRLRTSPKQFAVMVQFMERHYDLGRTKPGPHARLMSDKLWQELAEKLNAVENGVVRTAEKWKKVWADWKTKTKKKDIVLKNKMKNGGNIGRSVLSNLEQRVLAVMLRQNQESMVTTGEIKLEVPIQFTEESVSEETEFCEPVNIQSTSPTSHISAHQSRSPTPSLTPSPQPNASPSSPQASVLQFSASTCRRRSYDHLRSTVSPQHSATKPSKPPHAQRRRRTLTPFDRATSEFAAIELRRIRLEELRERNLQEEREERRRLDSRRLDLDAKAIKVFQGLHLLLERFLDKL